MIDTLRLGAQSAGTHGFDWPAGAATAASGLSFRVSATTGGVAVSPTALMRMPVESVSTTGGALQLQLADGRTVAYTDVKAVG